ncbi:membrane hypothetical protein [uncultured Eubacteriales bacterium]|uniref:Uncharacterized protein n=1 Tax=uncultured Eubacteriales bacterium TaxID=172733 RepID=A0A212IV64_9FIRM|nr:membrane hypothetical protein [uncultured Eubacteriales bacterium]
MVKKSDFRVAFPVASVWFGALVGPSMISGAFSATYFAPYGATGLLLAILSMGLASFIIAMGAEVVRREKTYSYSDLAHCIYGPWRKVLAPVLEVFMVFAMVVGGSAVASMGGTFFAGLTGMPELVGAVLMSLISIVLVLWGAGLVRASSGVMSVVMIVGMVLLSALAMAHRSDDLAAALTSFRLPKGVSLMAGISGAIALAFSNSCNALTLCAVEQNVSARSHSVAIGLCSLVLNSGAFILTTLLLLPYGSEVMADPMPTLTIVNTFLVEKAPWLPSVYMLTMFLALLSSGAPQLHAVAARVVKLYPDKGLFRSTTMRNLTTGVLYFALCIAISILGLRTIISKGYGILGSLALPLIVIPICVVMPLRYRRALQDKDISYQSASCEE